MKTKSVIGALKTNIRSEGKVSLLEIFIKKNIKTLFAFKTMLLRVLASMVFLGVKENHLSISLSAVSGLFLGS